MKKLKSITDHKLVLQHRVLDNYYSASREDHEWHDYKHVDPVHTTDDELHIALNKAEALIDSAPDRICEEYRVVLVSTVKTAWVLM